MIVFAVAHRYHVTDAFGSLLDMEVRSEANQVAAKHVIVDAASYLWRQSQEPGVFCICCCTAHVMSVLFISMVRAALTVSFAVCKTC